MSENTTNTAVVENENEEQPIPQEVMDALSFSVTRNGKSFQFEPRQKQRVDEAEYYPALKDDTTLEDFMLYYDVRVIGSLEQITTNLRDRIAAKHCQDAQQMYKASYVGPEGEKVYSKDRNIKLATELSSLSESKSELEERRRKLLKECLALANQLEAMTGDEDNYVAKVKEMTGKNKQMRSIDATLEARKLKRLANKAAKVDDDADAE